MNDAATIEAKLREYDAEPGGGYPEDGARRMYAEYRRAAGLPAGSCGWDDLPGYARARFEAAFRFVFDLGRSSVGAARRGRTLERQPLILDDEAPADQPASDEPCDCGELTLGRPEPDCKLCRGTGRRRRAHQPAADAPGTDHARDHRVEIAEALANSLEQKQRETALHGSGGERVPIVPTDGELDELVRNRDRYEPETFRALLLKLCGVVEPDPQPSHPPEPKWIRPDDLAMHHWEKRDGVNGWTCSKCSRVAPPGPTSTAADCPVPSPRIPPSARPVEPDGPKPSERMFALLSEEYEKFSGYGDHSMPGEAFSGNGRVMFRALMRYLDEQHERGRKA